MKLIPITLSFILIFLMTNIIAQNDSDLVENENDTNNSLSTDIYPVYGDSIMKLVSFVPKEWSVIDSVSFDFNNDSCKDYVVVIEKDTKINFIANLAGDTTEMFDKPRVLLVLCGSDNGFKLNCQSNNMIALSDQGGMMGDPFEGIEIIDNNICASYFGGSNTKWNLTHCFSYVDGRWVLQNVSSSGGNIDLWYSMDYNFETGVFNYEYQEEKYTKTIKLEDRIQMENFIPWTFTIEDTTF